MSNESTLYNESKVLRRFDKVTDELIISNVRKEKITNNCTIFISINLYFVSDWTRL